MKFLARRALRRKHYYRLKNKRKDYVSSGGGKRQLGRSVNTPCHCSDPNCCGNERHSCRENTKSIMKTVKRYPVGERRVRQESIEGIIDEMMDNRVCKQPEDVSESFIEL